MGASGAIVMGFFGAVFATMSLMLEVQLRGPILGLPAIVFLAIAACAVIVLRSPGQGVVRPRHTGRVMMWSTVGESVGVFVAISLVLNLGRLDLLIPSIALVVGLHFLPMAWGIPFRPLYATGCAIILSALIGFMVAQPLGAEVTGFSAALVLMASAIAAIDRDRRLKLRC